MIDNGGAALPPNPAGAVPGGPAAFTIPPRENGGNFDVKQLTAGSKLFLPVFKTGGLFSTGDAHFAQGDGEVCLTGVEIGATAVVRFQLHKGAAASRKFQGLVFTQQRYFADPSLLSPSGSWESWECRSQRPAGLTSRISPSLAAMRCST